MNLTLPQQDIYFEQLLFPDHPIYNIGAKISIKGTLDFLALNTAYVRLIEQHDSYNMILKREGEVVSVHIGPYKGGQLQLVDFSEEPAANDKAIEFMQDKFREPFDLTLDNPLYNFILVKVSEKFHYLFSVYHHIITDGWGTSLMFQRFVANYNEILAHEEVTTKYPYTYLKFLEDDYKYRSSEIYEKDKAYWTKKYSTLPTLLFNKITSIVPQPESKRKELIIQRSTYDKLFQIASSNEATTFHVILGVLYLYLGRRFQETDLAIGVPILNRSSHYYKKTVGLFMGVTALRMDLDYGDTFSELLKQIKLQLRRDYRYQRFPLGKLMHELPLNKKDPRLFDIALSYEKQDYAHNFDGTETRVIPLSHGAERVPLAIYIREFDANEDVKIDFDYNIHYFDCLLIDEFVGHFENLLHEVITDTEKELSDYSYLAESEKYQVLYEFNDTKIPYPENKTIIEFFKEQVADSPNSRAIFDEDGSFTYQELDKLSDKIAQFLTLEANIERGDSVALLMSRSPFLISAILGVFKAGGKYIPLDPSFPSDRIRYMVEHSRVQTVIGQERLQDLLPDSVTFIARRTLDTYSFSGKFTHNVSDRDAAYIIYTSGSTGIPKGVQISHHALLNFLSGVQRKLNLAVGEVLFSVTTQSFDISILEFLLPLYTGGSVYVASPDTLKDHARLIQELDKIVPDTIQATPSFFMLLLNAGWHAYEGMKVLCGGEALVKPVAESLLKQCCKLWNMYGPTETTIWSTCKRVTSTQNTNNVGGPIDNTRIYVLDDRLQVLPTETYGDIYIGGDGVADCYFKNHELTDERFLSDPFQEGERMYFTGDIGKWTHEGDIIFHGRSDNQVKIRGYRIELSEIEVHMQKLEAVKSAIVVAKRNEHEEAYLVGFAILQTSGFSLEIVKEELRKTLPDYMVPSIMVEVEEFPLTSNKKINRKALIEIELEENLAASMALVKPSTPLQSKLSELYKEALSLNREVGINEDFFTIGGHSLNAVRLAGKIEKELNCSISLKSLFDNSTVGSLSDYLSKSASKESIAISPLPNKAYYPLSNAQYPIWLACLQREKNAAYNMFRAFEISGDIDRALLREAVDEVIEKYEALRTNFVEIDGTPRQKIKPQTGIRFAVDAFNIEAQDHSPLLEAYTNKVFDLENDLLFNIGLFHTVETRFLLVVTHHIIMDGWSLEILIKEVSQNYILLSESKILPKESLPYQYKDFTLWQQRNELDSLSRNRKFWSEYMRDYHWQPLLPYDNQFSKAKSTGAFYFFNFKYDILIRLQKFSVERKITLHTLLVTAFQLLVQNVQQLNDICLGTINSGRPYSELHSQIGMFVKTLPLRRKLDTGCMLFDLMEQNQKDLLQIDIYQDIPEEIASDFRYEAIIVLQNQSFDYKNIYINQDLSLKALPINTTYNRLPLLLDFALDNGDLQGSVQYDTGKYEADTISIFMIKLESILNQIVSVPNTRVSNISAELSLKAKDVLDIDFIF